MAIKWEKVNEWIWDHPEEAMKDPFLQKFAELIQMSLFLKSLKRDPFQKATIFKKVSHEMPRLIDDAKALASPLREETLKEWQLFLELIVSKEYESDPEQIALKKYKPTLENYIIKIKQELPVQQKVTFNKLTSKQIIFCDPKKLLEFHAILKGHFEGQEDNLLKALKGEKLECSLLFQHNQNKLVEVFRRAKYNGFIISKPKEITAWLCNCFQFRYKRGSIDQIRKFNPVTVGDIISKGKGEPSKNERICFEGIDWLPYKSKTMLEQEALREQQ